MHSNQTERRTAAPRWRTAVLLVGTAIAGCGVDDDVSYSETSSAISVNTAVGGSCSTSSVRGLAAQIAREVDCAWPSSLTKFSSTSKIRFTSSAVLPFMHPSAKRDLTAVAANHPLRVNSGYRTVVQQYLLYRWWRAGRCGIAAAALPGRSNHESGRAIDLANWSTRVSAMRAHRWAHNVPGDPVHFEHLSSPDNRGKDVRAFQRLWNRNHPNDKIAVDGVYGPQTAARLKRAPAKGFAKGPQCATARLVVDDSVMPEIDLLGIEGPERVDPSARALYVISLANPEDVEWPATARLVTADGAASALYDPDTWISASEVGELGIAIPAHGDGDVAIEVATPSVTEETPYSLQLAVMDGPRMLGRFELALTVTPDGDAGTTTEGDTDEDLGIEGDEDGVAIEDGGCSAGGSSAPWLALMLLGILRRRRWS